MKWYLKFDGKWLDQNGKTATFRSDIHYYLLNISKGNEMVSQMLFESEVDADTYILNHSDYSISKSLVICEIKIINWFVTH